LTTALIISMFAKANCLMAITERKKNEEEG
jgi:hypothetical protein